MNEWAKAAVIALVIATSSLGQDRVTDADTIRARFGFPPDRSNEVVRSGVAFSADALTVIVRRDANGQRSERRWVARIYRDSKGRVRREAVFPAPADDQEPVVYIADPNRFFNATLNRWGQTIEGLPLPGVPSPLGFVGFFSMLQGASSDGIQSPNRPPVPTKTVNGWVLAGEPNRRGTTWRSRDLGVIFEVNSDDPGGSSVRYMLQNVSRAEPPAALFEIPAGVSSIP